MKSSSAPRLIKSTTTIMSGTSVTRPRTQEDIARYKRELSVDDHLLDFNAIAAKYNTDLIKGLTKQKAGELLAQNGPNALIPPAVKSRWLILMEYLFCGFAALLWSGAILTFVGYGLAFMKDPLTKQDSLYLGAVLIAVILITGFFGYYQEVQNVKIMDSFNKMIPKYATVIRDGERATIPSEELVVGDLVEMKMGDCVPADVRIISAESMKVDNSSLTGENLPQSRSHKCTNENPMETDNLAFYSTYVVEGSGMGVVISCGDDTLIGHIAGLTSSLEKVETPLQKEIRSFVVFITILAIFLGTVFFVISICIGYDFFSALMYFIAIIVANVPEGLPVTLTACMTLTAKRMANKNCMVKNIKAIEALGSCTVICSDKTGTLTQNRMTVSHVYYDGRAVEVLEKPDSVKKNNAAFQALANVAIHCSRAKFEEADPNVPGSERRVIGDASESAILKYVEDVIGDTTQKRAEMPKVCEIPFKSANKYQLSIHRQKNGRFWLVMKGAPERVIELCSSVVLSDTTQAMNPNTLKAVKKAVQDLGNLGERVLGFADLQLPETFGPKFIFNTDSPNFPTTGLRFCGLMSMVDPARPSVPEAVSKCKSAGIRVIMVTGDHPITAKAIAVKVGIFSANAITAYDVALKREVSVSAVSDKDKKTCNAAVVTGADLREMDETEIQAVLLKFHEIIFARTSPQQKLKIVEALQQLGNIVAVTGDGVNDSPALKQGDIGIAMGITGSDVSKETADMILLDDNFASIVTGIEEGRLIFDNLKKSIAYLLTSNVPEIVPFILLVALNIPQALSVVAIMIIDVGTDLWPAISLAYEKAEADIMKRKPRDMQRDRLVNFRMIYLTYFQVGVIQTAASMTSFFFILAQHGFFPDKLIGIREEWEEQRTTDLEDSYEAEWTFEERQILQYKCHSAYFLSIVITQIADLLICKTRRLSLFQQGMSNWVLNTGIIFEILLAGLVVFCPYLNTVLQFAPIHPISILLAVPYAFIILFYDEIRKYFIRKNPSGWAYRETYY